MPIHRVGGVFSQTARRLATTITIGTACLFCSIVDAREWRKTTSQVSHVRFGGDYQRTVVFIRYEAETGQDVFIRGGTPMADGVEDFSGEMMRLLPASTGDALLCVSTVYSKWRQL